MQILLPLLTMLLIVALVSSLLSLFIFLWDRLKR